MDETPTVDTTAREAADRAYALALACAKAEFDALLPSLTKLQNRVGALRGLIHMASRLLDVDVEDEYQYLHMRQDYRGRQHQQTTSTRTTRTGLAAPKQLPVATDR